MSSQQSSSSRSALPKNYFSSLVLLLRHANTRYTEAAAIFRRAYQPTHHARKRAQQLRLSVSIDAAKAIDPRQISVVPLPVLATPVPALEPATVSYQTAATRHSQRPVLRLIIPSMAVVGREREIKRLSEAATIEVKGATQTEIVPSTNLVAQAPHVLRGQNVPWRPLTSRWSATDSELSVTVETSEDSKSPAVTCLSDCMTDMEACSPAVAERVCSKAGRVVFLPAAVKPDTAFARSRKDPSVRLDAPVDITDRYSWSSDIPDLALVHSASSSSSCGDEPITPGSGDVPAATDCPYLLPLLAFQVSNAQAPRVNSSVKRKCSQSFIDMGYGEGETCSHASAEKRTKYQRKHWMNPAAAALRGSAIKRPVSPPTSGSGSADAGASFWQ